MSKKFLPGEVLGSESTPKKSAEVIVVTGNEPSRAESQIVGGLTQSNEGLNVKCVPNAKRRLASRFISGTGRD